MHGGVRLSLGGDERIVIKAEPGSRYAEITFFRSFEVSLALVEQAIVRCRDLCVETLREMRELGDDRERSWLRRAASSEMTPGLRLQPACRGAGQVAQPVRSHRGSSG